MNSKEYDGAGPTTACSGLRYAPPLMLGVDGLLCVGNCLSLSPKSDIHCKLIQII